MYIFQQLFSSNCAFCILLVKFSKDESFLEDVNMILNTGDIPNLYAKEERLLIIEKVQFITNQFSVKCCT